MSNDSKFESYREAWGRIVSSIQDGYFFEAVTLEESVISDRLLSYIIGNDKICKFDVKTGLAKLIAKMASIAKTIGDEQSLALAVEIDTWRERRNEIVHGLVKSYPGKSTSPVNDFLMTAEQTALEGKILARKVSDWHRARLAKSLSE
ncbi:MAG: hypothetical protein ACE37H_04260 [Phycisphaeraceae bacterium]